MATAMIPAGAHCENRLSMLRSLRKAELDTPTTAIRMAKAITIP